MAVPQMCMPMGMQMMPMGMQMMPMSMGMAMMPLAMQMPMMAMGMGMGMPMPMAMPLAGVSGAEANLESAQPEVEAEIDPVLSASDVEGVIACTELGEYVRVVYQHPQLGKTNYEGVLTEKRAGAAHEAYVQLEYCKRLGRRGQVRERVAKKRLMTAFIDDLRITTQTGSRSRSVSRSRTRSRSCNTRRRRSRPAAEVVNIVVPMDR